MSDTDEPGTTPPAAAGPGGLESPPPGTTANAGRGVLVIAGAKIWFVLTSYATQLALPRLFDSPEVFGRYAATLAGVSMLNNVLIVATIQTVSKHVAAREDAARAIARRALGVQLTLGAVLAGALFAAAPALAAFLLDDTLAPLLRVAAAVVLFYAVYATFVGLLNGRQRFGIQARLDASFSTLRTLGILGGAALGFGAFGAVAGWASAAGAVTLLGALAAARELRGTDQGAPAPALSGWLTFFVPLAAYHLCLNGLLLLDVQVLKRTAAELALAAGTTDVAAAARASELVGFYRAAQTFATVPYQLVLAATFVVFPAVSRATAQGRDDEARAAVRTTFRFALIALLAIAAPVAGAASGVLRIAYPEPYLAGADALTVLAFAMVAMALFSLCATVLGGAGQPARAALVAALSLTVLVVAVRAGITAAGPELPALEATAWGTFAGTTTAFLLAAGLVIARFGTLMPATTLLRVAPAAAAAALVAHAVPHASLVTALLALMAGFIAYGVVLVLLRELGPADFEAVRGALRRRKP